MSSSVGRVRWVVVSVLLALVAAGVIGWSLSGDDPEPAPPGQDSAATPTTQWADAGEVRGTVLHDGVPVKGVRVGIYGGAAASQPAVSAVSDAGGRFRMVGVPTGTDLLLETSSARPGGGRQGSEWAPVAPLEITLSADRGIAGVELAVAPTRTVTGRLQQKNGTPLAGVDVIAWRPASTAQKEATGSERDEWARALTDAKGRYTLENIPDGEWWIAADESFGFARPAAGAAPVKDAVRDATLDTFEPIRVSTPERVRVAGRSVKVAPLEVSRGRVVTGVVTDSTGAPVPKALVALQVPGEDWVQVRTTATDARGRYAFIRVKPVRVRVAVFDSLGRAGHVPPGDGGPEKARSTFAVQGRTVADVVVGD